MVMSTEKNVDEMKKKAAVYAVDFIESGMVVGLGTGSTASFAVKELARRINNGILRGIIGIPTSKRTESLANSLGIVLSTLERHPELDICIDGADEVDLDLNLIKGGGGALLREKVVAQCSKRNVIVVDESKLSKKLGSYPLPVEVLPFAWKPVFLYLESLGAKVSLRKKADNSIFITDQAHYILDCSFSSLGDITELSRQLKMRAGIIEHGFFLGTTTDLVVGTGEGIVYKTR